MQHAPDQKSWHLDGDGPFDRMQVACQLASLEPIDELCYRQVALEAVVIDVAPCRRSVAGVFYRCFRLRPLNRAVPGTPCRNGLPEEWTSEAISIPRQSRDGMESQLSRFETEFAVHTFLRRVECEIDALLDRFTSAPPGESSTRPVDAGGASYGCAGGERCTACV